MKSSTVIIAAAVLAAGALALGLCIRSGFNNFAYRDRVVNVRGLAEKEVKANKVTWPLVYTCLGNDLQQIYNDVERNNATVVEFLTANGITDQEISVNPPTVDDRKANAYSSNNITFRYAVSNVIVVTSEKVDQVRKLIDSQTVLLKKGVPLTSDYEHRTTYEYTALNDVKPDMIAEATRNARQAADKFAADSDSRLGKIKTASQGQFSISDRDNYTPYIKKIRVVSTIEFYLED